MPAENLFKNGLVFFDFYLVYSIKYNYNNIVAELFVIGTPIGNLGDITFRAVETLKNVDYVAAEDTRHTLNILNHFEIKKPLISCRAQNEKTAGEKIIALLKDGHDVAYASDAGTPGVSDPGAVLVDMVRDAGFNVVPIPGPSAFATLVSVAGTGGKTLIFEGFLSPKPGKRRSRLKELMDTKNAVIIYESPFRIVKLLSDIADIESTRRIVVGRELTKMHEEITSGSARQLFEDYSSRQSIKGEFAIFISGVKNAKHSEESADN